MATFIILALAVLLAIALLKFVFLNREIRQLNRALTHITQADTNTQLTLRGGNKNIAAFAQTINRLLAQNRGHNYEKIQTENQLKSAITNISHDLRTPLTSAKGYLQMLPAAPAEVQEEYLNIAIQRLDSLSTQLANLFDFAQVLEGGAPIQWQAVNLCTLAKDLLVAHYTQLETSGLAVAVDIPHSPIMAKADPAILTRILENLIKNAYTHGAEIFRLAVDGEGIFLTNKILTNKIPGGKNIDPAQLFDRFYTADAARNSQTTGVGLAIVKTLTQRLGWRVEATINDDEITVAIFYKPLLLE